MNAIDSAEVQAQRSGDVESLLRIMAARTRIAARTGTQIDGAELRTAVADWLPTELAAGDRNRLLESLVTETLAQIDFAIDFDPTLKTETAPSTGNSVPAETDEADVEVQAEEVWQADREGNMRII